MDTPSVAETSLQQLGIGERLEAQGDADGALAAYHEALKTIERLAQQNPGSRSFQYGLLLADAKIGDNLARRGRIEEALAAYRAHHEGVLAMVIESESNLAELGPALCASIEKVGLLLRKQGDGEGALKAYRRAQTIYERVVAHEPTNATHQRAFARNQIVIGELLSETGERPEALRCYEKASEALQRVVEQESAKPSAFLLLSVVEEEIGEMRRLQGDGAGALEAFRADLAWAKRLKAEDTDHPMADISLFSSWVNIGDTLLEMDDGPGALRAYQGALKIAGGQSDRDPDWSWRDHVIVLYDKIARAVEQSKSTSGQQ
ncbi:MAG: tetratricopeptide repeat protein [Nitrospirae bacterium]|nr:tetratricopeptide repeat protein [Nitrospirota bacterium]